MTHAAAIFGKLTFATAVQYSVNLAIYRWAGRTGSLDRLFPGSTAALHFPAAVDADIVQAIDTAIKESTADPLALSDAEINQIIDAGYRAGVASIERFMQGESATGG